MENRFSEVWDNREWQWPKSDVHCWKHMNFENNGPKVIRDVARFLDKEERTLVIQAGGNCGMYPSHYLKYFQRVITFEPDPLNFKCLINNCDNSKRLTAIQGVLGKTSGKMIPIRRSKKNIGATHVSKAPPTLHSMVFSIDSLNVKPAIIHLDVEEYELKILEGTKKTLKRHKPIIVCEIKEDHRFLVWDFIKNYGYELVKQLTNGDYVYAPKG